MTTQPADPSLEALDEQSERFRELKSLDEQLSRRTALLRRRRYAVLDAIREWNRIYVGPSRGGGV